MSFLEANSWEILALTIVKFAKESFLNLVDILDFHNLWLLFDFHLLKESVPAYWFAVLALIFIKNCLNVFSKLGRVLKTGNSVIIGKLSLEYLLVEKSRELDNYCVAEWIAVIDFHVTTDVELLAIVFKLQFEINLVPNNQGRQLVVVSRRLDVLITALLHFALLLSERHCADNWIHFFVTAFPHLSFINQWLSFLLHSNLKGLLLGDVVLLLRLEIFLVLFKNIETMWNWDPFRSLDEFFNGPIAFGFIRNDSSVNVDIIKPQRTMFRQVGCISNVFGIYISVRL